MKKLLLVLVFIFSNASLAVNDIANVEARLSVYSLANQMAEQCIADAEDIGDVGMQKACEQIVDEVNNKLPIIKGYQKKKQKFLGK